MIVEVEMDQDPASIGEVYLISQEGNRFSIATILWERQGFRDCKITVIYDGIRGTVSNRLIEIVDKLIKKILKKWGYSDIVVNHEK